MNKNISFRLILKILPSKPGVYYFYNKYGRVIYVGKAASLKNRVKSYFVGVHDTKTEKLISHVSDLKYKKTNSIVEALILEANEIKRLKPKYNIREKDDKSFAYIFLTREDFPRVFVDRITNLKILKRDPSSSLSGVYTEQIRSTQDDDKIKYRQFGPFTEGESAQKALEILRRIFKFRDCNNRKFNLYKKRKYPCLFEPLKLCPAPCVGNISKDDYRKTVREISLFLSGKKKILVTRLRKQMNLVSKHQRFELAGKIRDKIFSLKHIQDVALIKEERPLEQLCSIPHRIEAYDISNIGGQFAVGSMVVFTGGVVDKKEYRKFRIKEISNSSFVTRNSNRVTSYKLQVTRPNDPQMLAQIVERRLNHPEWPTPDLILLDGGTGQLSAVTKIINKFKLLFRKQRPHKKGKYLTDKDNYNLPKIIQIPVIALAKGPTRKGFRLYKNAQAKKIMLDKKLLEHLRDEAHRFAISYHRKLIIKSLTMD